jgi:hypothetical protein
MYFLKPGLMAENYENGFVKLVLKNAGVEKKNSNYLQLGFLNSLLELLLCISTG